MSTRREFVTLGGAAAAAWPIAARAQQTIRRIGMLLPAAADDAEFQTRAGAFLEGLQQSGWTIGQNVRIDSRWATTNAVEIRRHAAELAALAPDAILASSSPALAALQQATRTVPIVFVNVIDPVGSGFVDSLTRPTPKRTPLPIVQKLHADTIATLDTAAVQDRLKDIGATAVSPERRSPEYLQSFVVSEIAKWGAAIKAANIKIE